MPPGISFTNHRQIGVLQHRLGRIGAAELANDPAPVNRPELTLVHGRADHRRVLPCGAETRKIDTSNRIKLHPPTGPVAQVLGWTLGSLDAVMVDGWLARFGFVRERITFRPAHLECLGATKGDYVLIAAVPDAAALIVVNPAVCLSVAPGHIAALFDVWG